MREELDFKGNELLIYALIFDRSSAGKCWFTTQHKYFSKWCGCSRQSVISAINNLVNSGINIVTNKTIQKVDNVLQNDITESIKNILQDIQSEAGKQFGADGVEDYCMPFGN